MAQAAQRLVKNVVTLTKIVVEQTPLIVRDTVTYSRPRLATFWHYARVELAPPSPADIPKAIDGIKGLVQSFQKSRYSELTVRESIRNGLVATEVLFWFYIGECIGKGGLVGYNV